MKYIYNNRSLKTLRKVLRNNMTDAEIKLWSRLKGKQLYGHKFRRQHSVGRFIVDFYCPQFRLAIEIDGGHHNDLEQEANDKEKTLYLKQNGITTIRFWNHEVLENTDDVLNAIIHQIDRIIK